MNLGTNNNNVRDRKILCDNVLYFNGSKLHSVNYACLVSQNTFELTCQTQRKRSPESLPRRRLLVIYVRKLARTLC